MMLTLRCSVESSLRWIALRPTWMRTLPGATSNSLERSFCKDYASSSDDEKEAKKSKKHSKTKKVDEKVSKPVSGSETWEESAAARLNRLLASMPADDPYKLNKTTATESTINSSRPGAAAKKRREAGKEETESKDIFTAAKRVAALMSNEEQQQKQTESDLLGRLLGHNKQAGAVDAADESKAKASDKNDMSLSELIVGMKIDRKQRVNETQFSRADYVRGALASARFQKNQRGDSHSQHSGNKPMRPRHKREAEAFTGSVNLFGAKPLGIFNASECKDSPDMLDTWAYLQQRELQLEITHPPRNYFEKIAMWTEKGKVWRFPIDNEQDWLDEKDVDFTEHIFLDQHLEGWCPTKGPIRHFMELVCVGLSKNPYITAREKKEHILWYRDYFEQKKELLGELMTMQREQKRKAIKESDGESKKPSAAAAAAK